MSKHTPGPWGVEWQRPCYWLIRDESGSGVHLPPGDSIDDPNRLLIERAPETKRQRDELLAAVADAIHCLNWETGEVFHEEASRVLVAAYEKATEEGAWCPGDKLGGVCPGIESGVNSDCPKWKEEA